MEFAKSKSDDTVTVTNHKLKLGTIKKSIDGIPFFMAASGVAFRIDSLFEIAFAMAAMVPEKDITVNE